MIGNAIFAISVFHFLLNIDPILAACTDGPCPGKGMVEGQQWCASGGANYMKYYAVCHGGCAVFQQCPADTECRFTNSQKTKVTCVCREICPVPGKPAGAQWCAKGDANYFKYFGTCTPGGCAYFRACAPGTKCKTAGNGIICA